MDKYVFLVHHVHEFSDGTEDVKFIGAYETNDEASAAVERSKNLPGFADMQQGFQINKYKLGEDHWTEGFFTPDVDGE